MTDESRLKELEKILKESEPGMGLPHYPDDCTGPLADTKLEYVRLYNRLAKRKHTMKKKDGSSSTSSSSSNHPKPVWDGISPFGGSNTVVKPLAPCQFEIIQ